MALSRFQKIVATGAAAAAIGGTALSASAFASTPGSARPAGRPAATAQHMTTAQHKTTAQHMTTAQHTTAVRQSPDARRAAADADAPISRVVGHGGVDGLAWSVTLEFYPTLPAGFPTGAKRMGAPMTEATGLLCQRMVIGGVRIDHQGGPWSDCGPVQGAHDPSASGEEGLWGLHDKGTSGSRLMVGNTAANVAYSVLTFADGTRATGRAATVPHTSYRAWAVAIPDGETIATVDTFDARHHRLSHETDWR
ncbi:hypothetical protein V2S66_10595 [Streptomyces sp. V4-01]|uniref:Uncharacterized protein n=1 Tax=Actinacidiphila polyblastidii TaxID=3110430 RepID=A0ABU7P9C0_9ACTN|nr:hypothetical protein [Streptomyces sp. V4-01]